MMNNAWKFLGGCGCLSSIVGAVLIGLSFFAGESSGGALLERKPDLAHYANTREGRTGNLLESYVDFSFDYPKTWTLKTADPDNINFVTAERSVDGKTYENINVGYFTPAATEAENQQLYTQVLGQIEGQFSQQFRDFRKVTEGPTRIGEYDAHHAVYDGWVEVDGKRVGVFVRAAFIPQPGGNRGVSMMMIGTTINPALTEAADLGAKGELPIVLQSFKFGP
jgi:hypothetical protein